MADAWVMDEERCYRAVSSRDVRFDGWFYVGVTSTGIFCRPSCPATTPRRANVRFFRTAGAAQGAGFRACRRCRPDTAPGSPEWNVRADLAGRAMALINDGLVDREGVGGLARRLAVSERHLHRLLLNELGAGPLTLARARRAQTARLLIETTALPFTEIAFAAGFASIRQFNDTVREVFGANPTVLRADRTSSLRRSRGGSDRRNSGPGARAAASTAPASSPLSEEGPLAAAMSRSALATTATPGPVPISLRLATRPPFAGSEALAFLGLRAVPGVEAFDGACYRRVLPLPHGVATVALTAADDHIDATLWLADLRDLGPAVERCRRLLDLDADPESVSDVLGADPLLAPLVAATPGRRSPGAVNGAEMLVRAVVGQQVSVAGARTVLGRIAAAHGVPLESADHPSATRAVAAPASEPTCSFPTAALLADVDPESLPMPRSRGRALVDALALVADGSLTLDPGADRAEVEARLLSVKGIGPWTASYVAMRALGDPDVFLPTDLGVLRGLAAVGGPDTSSEAAERSIAWRPWRSYALHHLWAAG